MNIVNLVGIDPRIKKLVIFQNMAEELEGEPAMNYAIKLHLLLQVNVINKNLKNKQLEQYCR